MDTVILVAGPSFSLFGIFLAIPFWLIVFLLRSQLLAIWGLPCMLLPVFFLAAFKVLSLSLNFAILVMMCLGVGLFGFILTGTLCASWTCVTFSPIKLGKFSMISFSNRFSILCSSSSGIPIIQILLHFILSCSSFNPSLFFLSLFFLFLFFLGVFFYHVLQLTDSILCFM